MYEVSAVKGNIDDIHFTFHLTLVSEFHYADIISVQYLLTLGHFTYLYSIIPDRQVKINNLIYLVRNYCDT